LILCHFLNCSFCGAYLDGISIMAVFLILCHYFSIKILYSSIYFLSYMKCFLAKEQLFSRQTLSRLYLVWSRPKQHTSQNSDLDKPWCVTVAMCSMLSWKWKWWYKPSDAREGMYELRVRGWVMVV